MGTCALTDTRKRVGSGPEPAKNRFLQRQCACGQHTVGGATCDACKARTGRMHERPGKALGEVADDHGEEKPSPRQGSASIQCNGAGGWEITYGGYAGAACGTKNCVTAHESSHLADWQAKWPNGCTGQAKGYVPKGDPPDNPLMTVAQYDKFLKDSECRAHTADLDCANALPKTGACKQTVESYINLTERQKKNWCGGLSKAARIAISLAGAVGGALLGNVLGDGPGAAIGAGVGALAGGFLGSLF